MNVEELARVAKEYRDAVRDLRRKALDDDDAAETGIALDRFSRATKRLDRCIARVLEDDSSLPITGTVEGEVVNWARNVYVAADGTAMWYSPLCDEEGNERL